MLWALRPELPILNDGGRFHVAYCVRADHRACHRICRCGNCARKLRHAPKVPLETCSTENQALVELEASALGTLYRV
jgi:hypothetical protein